MHRILQTYVDRLFESNNTDDLREGMTATATALNLRCFAYLCIPNSLEKSPILISSYPSNWTAYYLQQQYQRFDPVIVQAIRRPAPFQWGLGVGPAPKSDKARALFEEAARFGIRYGFTIPVHEPGGTTAAMTFAADERRTSFDRTIQKHSRTLQLMGFYFHAHARRRLNFDRVVDGVSLSPREFECLEWSSRGKSAWEIGNILGISRRTAAFHLDNARAKLGVRTIRQAVVRLVESRSRK